jgi:hypothetical protein
MLQVKQSINLYLEQFQPAKLPLPVQKAVKVLLITLVGLILVTCISLLVRTYYVTALQEAKAEQELLNEELRQVLAQLPNNVIDKNLEAKISREEKLLAKQRRVITFLRQDSISDSSSFTPIVEQLSHQSVDNIWLSKFEVINQGKDIQLFGYSKTPEQVSRYLTMLGTQPAYQGRAFKQINVKRSDHAWNEFFLSTKKEELDEGLIQQTIIGAGL